PHSLVRRHLREREFLAKGPAEMSGGAAARQAHHARGRRENEGVLGRETRSLAALFGNVRRLLPMLAVLAAVLTFAPAQEVQLHELVFEKWVRDTFFAGYRPASSTQDRKSTRLNSSH